MDKQILNIINERQLVSIMNATKWNRLVEGISTLPFAPAFQLKMITELELVPPTFSSHITYLGDWQHLEIKSWRFSAIEWIKIRPVLYRHVGQLLPDEKIDISNELQQLLVREKLHYEQVNGDFVVYGYVPKS